jgi:hypothetical protein
LNAKPQGHRAWTPLTFLLLSLSSIDWQQMEAAGGRFCSGLLSLSAAAAAAVESEMDRPKSSFLAAYPH